MFLRGHVRRRLFRKKKERFYALRDLTFRLGRGESVAVVGRNGAGKSTLLSLMAGLAAPDAGRVAVEGRVAALLELGSGFHPDLTGLENLRLNAALLGLSREETAARADEIVAFSGLAEFVGQPLRTYSSGMIVRLAFSVAVLADPAILLIDEVLAVGDQAFQAKSFDKILELRRAGKTIVCVSHAPGLVARLCDRALWLDRGKLILDGPLEEVQAAYQSSGTLSQEV